MEKFINDLYSNSNFPIILCVLIAVFTVLFIITLFLALRDAKKNEESVEKMLDGTKDEKSEDVPVETKELKEEVEPTFEDITFNEKEEEKSEEVKYPGVSFEPTLEKKEETNNVDVIEETTTTIPVLKDDEISNFENFFLENLKDKEEDNNVFDFTEKKEEEPAKKIELEPVDVNFDFSSLEEDSKKSETPEIPASVEADMPKMKADYSYKQIERETYKINK